MELPMLKNVVQIINLNSIKIILLPMLLQKTLKLTEIVVTMKKPLTVLTMLDNAVLKVLPSYTELPTMMQLKIKIKAVAQLEIYSKKIPL